MISFLSQCCGYFIGLLVYMETLRFLRLLRFNRKVALFGSTMMYISKPLLSFGLVFMSGFLAFSTTAYFFFNTYMFDFRTFMATLNTLLSMMLGKLVLTGDSSLLYWVSIYISTKNQRSRAKHTN